MFSTKKGGLEDLFLAGPSRNLALSGKEYFGIFSNGLSPGKTEDGKFSYFNRSGKQVISKKFASAEPFSNGLACVSNLNEFGKKKYGFIDINGKLVIPYTFSTKPGSFRNGLAYIEPANQSDFNFAFINKTGEVLFKQVNVKPLLVSDKKPEFNAGLFVMLSKDSQSKLKIIDSTGIDTKYTNVLRKINPILTYASHIKISENVLIFNYEDNMGRMGRGVGLANLQTGQLIYTPFSTIDKFDPVSSLSLANDSKGGGQVYIDQTSNIVIGMLNRSEW